MGYCDKVYKKFLEGLEIIEGNDGFYIKNNPSVTYKTRKEAEEAVQLIEKLITIC